MVVLRTATAADSDRIRELIHSAKLNPMGLKWHRFTVAVSPTGQVIGCIQYKPHRPEIIELASLVVDPEWRKKGVGKLLVEHLKEEKGAPLWLMCASPTAPYYEPFGFATVHELSNMPAYFRRTARVFGLFHRFIPSTNRLTIMVWQ